MDCRVEFDPPLEKYDKTLVLDGNNIEQEAEDAEGAVDGFFCNFSSEETTTRSTEGSSFDRSAGKVVNKGDCTHSLNTALLSRG